MNDVVTKIAKRKQLHDKFANGPLDEKDFSEMVKLDLEFAGVDVVGTLLSRIELQSSIHESNKKIIDHISERMKKLEADNAIQVRKRGWISKLYKTARILLMHTAKERDELRANQLRLLQAMRQAERDCNAAHDNIAEKKIIHLDLLVGVEKLLHIREAHDAVATLLEHFNLKCETNEPYISELESCRIERDDWQRRHGVLEEGLYKHKDLIQSLKAEVKALRDAIKEHGLYNPPIHTTKADQIEFARTIKPHKRESTRQAVESAIDQSKDPEAKWE